MLWIRWALVRVGVMLHNGSITRPEARWALQKALTYRQ